MPKCPMTQSGGFSERATIRQTDTGSSLSSEHFNSRDPARDSRNFDVGEIMCEARENNR